MQMSHEELVDAHMALVAAQAESLIANQHLQERIDRLTEDINQSLSQTGERAIR